MENIVEIKIEDEKIVFYGEYNNIFNRISYLPDKMFSFTNIEHLMMYKNYIKTIYNKDE